MGRIPAQIEALLATSVEPLVTVRSNSQNSVFPLKKCCSLHYLIVSTYLPNAGNSPTEPAIPTKGETCPQHSARIKRLSSNNDWLAMCSQAKLQEKSNNGTITMQDLISCYRPDCNSNSYAPKQCHAIGRRISQVEYCWCSGPTGLSIPDTLTSDMQPNVCCKSCTHTHTHNTHTHTHTLNLKEMFLTREILSVAVLRQSCQYKGTQYADGEVFQPDHQCGIW